MEPTALTRAIAAAERPAAAVPVVRRVAADDLGQIEARHRRRGAGARDRCRRRVVPVGARRRDHAAVLRAVFAQHAGELSRVDVADAEDARVAQIGRQVLGAAPVADQTRQVADHQSGGKNAPGFDVFRIDAGIADVRVSQGNDLAGIRRVGQDFLVPGHRGVENDFADAALGRVGRADRAAAKQAAVGKRQDRGDGGGNHGTVSRKRVQTCKAGKACSLPRSEGWKLYPSSASRSMRLAT